MTGYRIGLISARTKEKLMQRIYSSELYERKAAIHGCCVKIFTDSHEFIDMWESNFEPMPDWIRPHARMFAIRDGKKMKAEYEPVSKTAIVRNCNYYGWIKSIALGIVADFLEDVPSEHRRHSVHGSFVDLGGRGIAIIGPSKSGKTTLTYGLLLDKCNNFLTDDWFFVRLTENETLVFSSEKNSYIGGDLAENWPQYGKRLQGVRKDNRSRAVVDVKRFFGGDRIRKNSTLGAAVLLTRERGKPPIKRLSAAEAARFMAKHDFCNPHQLVRTRRKKNKRLKFFKELFARVPVYLLNTIETPKQSLERLKKVCKQIG